MSSLKLEAARSLAKSHYRVDRQIRQIHLIEPLHDQDPNEPIRLLEVVEGALECGIVPIAFTPDPDHGIEYPSVIVEVSPTEFDKIQDGTMPLTHENWTIGQELFA